MFNPFAGHTWAAALVAGAILILTLAVEPSEAQTSPRIIIDALEGKSWNGIVFSAGPNNAFAVRFGAFLAAMTDEFDVYANMAKVGPHAPDGSYAAITWRVGPGAGDFFSIRWEGKLNIPTDGDYIFTARADDGVRMWIDGEQIIDEWDQHAPTDFSGHKTLKKGEHDLRLDYFELIGGASISLSWEGPNIKRQIIGQEHYTFEGKHGLQGSYFVGKDFDHFSHKQIDPKIEYDWGAGGPVEPSTEGGLLSLEWSVIDGTSVVGKLSLEGKNPARIVLQGYNPWDYKARWTTTGKGLQAQSEGACFELKTSEEALSMGGAENTDQLKQDYFKNKKLTIKGSEAAVGAEYSLLVGQSIFFTAAVSLSRSAKAPDVEPTEINLRLDHARKLYEQHRPQVSGFFDGTAQTIADNLFWMTLLIPHKDKTYTPAGRPWIWSDWTVFEWDGFLNAVLLAVEDPARARNMVDAMMMSQLPDGNIPNFGGGSASKDRSQPPIGTYCVYKLYQRFGRDKNFLRSLYPGLAKWHKWWLEDPGTGAPRRDGNKDGLLEWGSNGGNLQDAKFESGMDDCPLWDDAEFVQKTQTMDMNAVDACALYALDCDIMAMIADELGEHDDAVRYRTEYENLKNLMNEKMWSEEDGMYLDLFWDGRLSHRMGVSNFYPLLAGIPDENRQQRMKQVMRDPAKFWGSWVLPTISRDDKAYPNQQYWRGTVWPPSNYICYSGMKRAGWDAEAAYVAERGVEMFLGNAKRTGQFRENFSSIDGSGGGQLFQSWGPLFSLIGLEEIIDVDPWNGLRFGSLTESTSRVERLNIAGQTYDVIIGKQTTATRDGKIIFQADGPVVVRGWKQVDGKTLFNATAIREIHANVFDGDADGSVTIHPGRGDYTVKTD